MDVDVDKESSSTVDHEEQPMYEKSGDQMEPDAVPLETESCRSPYNPRSALVMAILDWLPELYKTKTSCGVTRPNRVGFMLHRLYSRERKCARAGHFRC